MPKRNELKTVGELLFWSYANLAMADATVSTGKLKYGRLGFMIRARLFKGLKTGSMSPRSLFDDEKVKLHAVTACSYCGAQSNLSVDHLVPQFAGGKDSGDNLILACRSCNSSKGKKDLMEWMDARGEFPPLMVLRRYLKLAIRHYSEAGLLDDPLTEIVAEKSPFNLNHIPTTYPKPADLRLLATASV